MAFTASLIMNTVFGNLRVVGYTVTPDATTGNVQTILNNISFGFAAPVSCVTVSGNSKPLAVFKYNALAAGTAAAGYFNMTSAVANDVYSVVLFGS